MTVDRNWKCNENVEDEQDDAIIIVNDCFGILVLILFPIFCTICILFVLPL